MKHNVSTNLAFLQQDLCVLKPSNLTRGTNIFFGRDHNKEAWENEIEKAMISETTWVVQELCHLRKTLDGKNGDIAVFIVEGIAIGAISRVSDSMVSNIGNGGFLQPVAISPTYQEEFMDKIPGDFPSS